MRKKLIIGLSLVLLVVIFGFQWSILQNPEVQKRNLALVRDTPAWIFYPVIIGFTVMILGPILWVVVNQKRWSRMATRGSVRNAKKIVLSFWRVDGTPMLREDFAVVRFRHMSFGRWAFILPVRPGHPDIELFRKLEDGDVVEFEALTEGMACALEHELCGFLRIKSVR